jgi:hypothetical protein
MKGLPSPSRKSLPGALLPICLASACLSPLPADAAEFALAVSPPRFELRAKPNERIHEVIEVTNAAAQAGTFRIKTVDWDFMPDASVLFREELEPGSCRPWVAIERRELTVLPGQSYRFRFEVSPPAGQPPVECRFAILLEGQEQSAKAGALAIPLAGRMGVIVYVAVGDVAPQLSVASSSVMKINGQASPVLQVHNSGTAHGRMEGFLSGTDASGQRLEFSPAGTPILPGETRTVTLSASRPGTPDTAVIPKYPVVIRGKLEWGDGRSTDLDQRFME